MKKNVMLICIDGMAAYNLDNPRLNMPNLKGLIEDGIKADGMRVAYPSVTWAMNTSMITGTYPKKHGVLGNWVVDRVEKKIKEPFGDRDFNKEDIVQVPTLYDIAHQNGWKTASICWPLTRGAKHIDFNIPEFYDQELFEEYCTPELWSELKEKGLPIDQYGAWSKDHARGNMQDWLSTEIAKHLIETHKPNLLMIHYLLADSLQHDYGVGSAEALWSMNYIDERIGELIKTLKKEGLFEQTDIFVVSDHGFAEIEFAICPNILFEQNGWFDKSNPENSKVIDVSNGGAGYISILDKDENNMLLKQVKEKLLATEGVEAVFESEEFAALGLPAADEHRHQADLIIEAKDGYFVDFISEGDQVVGKSKRKGMHGYLHQK
jgi:predicted AlkP superfamily pyrophosphatase or phosphodiesterase